MSETRKLISIVVPVFNEAENVKPLHDAVARVMESVADRYNYELIFTDNHSTDHTFLVIQELAKCNRNIRAVRFSRNFGFQRSIFTGYCHARGDAAVQLDCDLQDPPELIPEFLARWEEGYQVVYGIRRSRPEVFYLRLVRKIFYRLIDLLSEYPLPHDAGDFRLVDRRVLQELKKIDDYQPYLRGSIATLGFNQIGVPYDRLERAHGKTKFSMGDLMGLALDGILNHSIIPLRIATFTGLTVSVLTFVGLIIYSVGKVTVGKDWPPGFATATALTLISLSLNALFLGIIGEYLGRIYQQIKRGPTTVIESAIESSISVDTASLPVRMSSK